MLRVDAPDAAARHREMRVYSAAAVTDIDAMRRERCRQLPLFAIERRAALRWRYSSRCYAASPYAICAVCCHADYFSSYHAATLLMFCHAGVLQMILCHDARQPSALLPRARLLRRHAL